MGLSLAAAARPQVQSTHTCTLQHILNTRGGAKLFNLSRDTSDPRLLLLVRGKQPLLSRLDLLDNVPLFVEVKRVSQLTFSPFCTVSVGLSPLGISGDD